MVLHVFMNTRTERAIESRECQGAAGHAADSSKSLLKAGPIRSLCQCLPPRVRFDACPVSHSISAEGLARTSARGLYFGGLMLGGKSSFKWKSCEPRDLVPCLDTSGYEP